VLYFSMAYREFSPKRSGACTVAAQFTADEEIHE
jgi:hypothetical protein